MGELFDIEKIGKKRKEKKSQIYTLKKKTPLSKDLSIFLSKKMTKCFANSITLGSEHGGSATLGGQFLNILLETLPGTQVIIQPNTSPSIQGFDNTNLKTQEVDEYM